MCLLLSLRVLCLKCGAQAFRGSGQAPYDLPIVTGVDAETETNGTKDAVESLKGFDFQMQLSQSVSLFHPASSCWKTVSLV